MNELNYLTKQFVRSDCGIDGAQFTDKDCDRIIAEVKRLHSIKRVFEK